jgi:hypothetical protein
MLQPRCPSARARITRGSHRAFFLHLAQIHGFPASSATVSSENAARSLRDASAAQEAAHPLPHYMISRSQRHVNIDSFKAQRGQLFAPGPRSRQSVPEFASPRAASPGHLRNERLRLARPRPPGTIRAASPEMTHQRLGGRRQVARQAKGRILPPPRDRLHSAGPRSTPDAHADRSSGHADDPSAAVAAFHGAHRKVARSTARSSLTPSPPWGAEPGTVLSTLKKWPQSDGRQRDHP